MPARMFAPPSMRKALPILLLSAACALCACTGTRNASAPVPADPDREHSQGEPLQSAPSIEEQRIGEPAHSRTQTTRAQQPASAAPATPAAAPRARTAPAQADSGYIILQPGETLGYISALYSVSEKNLMDWNGLNSAQDIRVGQRLAIRPPGNAPRTERATPPAARERAEPPQPPATGTAPATPDAPDAEGMITVQPGQTLSNIAAKYKVRTADLRKWNKLKNDRLKAGQKLRVTDPARVHTVKAGESLGRIAVKYKVSVDALMRKNKLANADVLPVGKELIIP